MYRQIRQGDVLLIAVDGVQPPADARHTSEVVLALGEVTGHAHRLQAADILEWSEDDQRYVYVLGHELGSVTHEEHDPRPAPVVAPEMAYRVVPQREWDLRGQWRPVVD